MCLIHNRMLLGPMSGGVRACMRACLRMKFLSGLQNILDEWLDKQKTFWCMVPFFEPTFFSFIASFEPWSVALFNVLEAYFLTF